MYYFFNISFLNFNHHNDKMLIFTYFLQSYLYNFLLLLISCCLKKCNIWITQYSQTH